MKIPVRVWRKLEEFARKRGDEAEESQRLREQRRGARLQRQSVAATKRT